MELVPTVHSGPLKRLLASRSIAKQGPRFRNESGAQRFGACERLLHSLDSSDPSRRSRANPVSAIVAIAPRRRTSLHRVRIRRSPRRWRAASVAAPWSVSHPVSFGRSSRLRAAGGKSWTPQTRTSALPRPASRRSSCCLANGPALSGRRSSGGVHQGALCRPARAAR